MVLTRHTEPELRIHEVDVGFREMMETQPLSNLETDTEQTLLITPLLHRGMLRALHFY